MKIDGINKQTGEIVKPYETPQHLDIKNIIQEQVDYVNRNLKDENGEMISKLDGDTLSFIMVELTAMYETLSRWLADEKLHVAELKAQYDLKFARIYYDNKQKKKETNETARMLAKLECEDELNELNKHKHGYDVIESWKKTVGRYHDTVRSQLSYEKHLAQMGRG